MQECLLEAGIHGEGLLEEAAGVDQQRAGLHLQLTNPLAVEGIEGGGVGRAQVGEGNRRLVHHPPRQQQLLVLRELLEPGRRPLAPLGEANVAEAPQGHGQVPAPRKLPAVLVAQQEL